MQKSRMRLMRLLRKLSIFKSASSICPIHRAVSPMFDWLRKMYLSMGYYVKHGEAISEESKALIGLLTGNPASPILWILLMANLIILPDLDDVGVENVQMAMMVQADDILLVSLSARGLHAKLKLSRNGVPSIDLDQH
jgi:hypothetical protein